MEPWILSTERQKRGRGTCVSEANPKIKKPELQWKSGGPMKNRKTSCELDNKKGGKHVLGSVQKTGKNDCESDEQGRGKKARLENTKNDFGFGTQKLAGRRAKWGCKRASKKQN